MIDEIQARVTEIEAEVDEDHLKKMARLEVVIFSDDKIELQDLLLRITQVMHPIPRLLRCKDMIE